MPIYDIYSRRQRAGEPANEVYQYDDFPENVRTQILFILEGSIGYYYTPSHSGYGTPPAHNNKGWDHIRHVLCREWGQQSLANDSGKADIVAFLYGCRETSKILDFLEIVFRYIDNEARRISQYQCQQWGITQRPTDAIEEFNFRLREAAIGYQFEGGQIIRVDNQYLHTEVVIPALTLLNDQRFAGPQEEYLSAHAHYRAGEHKDAIVDANNAFESTMKAICDIKGWDLPEVATAPNLVKTLRGKGLLPDYLGKVFDQLAATLKSGLPQVRNQEGGHGQGAAQRETPGYVASYALHLAAAKMVFMIEAMNENM